MTREIATINFIDGESGDEAVAVIRTINGSIALCLSLQSDGDIEVTLNPRDCELLVEALREAVSAAIVPQ